MVHVRERFLAETAAPSEEHTRAVVRGTPPSASIPEPDKEEVLCSMNNAEGLGMFSAGVYYISPFTRLCFKNLEPLWAGHTWTRNSHLWCGRPGFNELRPHTGLFGQWEEELRILVHTLTHLCSLTSCLLSAG